LWSPHDGGFKNGMLGCFIIGMFVVYTKWYVRGLHKVACLWFT
jgi:ascorbate-specific PTS system EIIC-type component UlaA